MEGLLFMCLLFCLLLSSIKTETQMSYYKFSSARLLYGTVTDNSESIYLLQNTSSLRHQMIRLDDQGGVTKAVELSTSVFQFN